VPPVVALWKLSMAEGYCVKCKAKKEITDAVEETMKNGRKAIKGAATPAAPPAP